MLSKVVPDLVDGLPQLCQRLIPPSLPGTARRWGPEGGGGRGERSAQPKVSSAGKRQGLVIAFHDQVISGIPRQLSGLWLKNRALLYKRDGKGEGEGERGRVRGREGGREGEWNIKPANQSCLSIYLITSVPCRAVRLLPDVVRRSDRLTANTLGLQTMEQSRE